MEVHLEIKNDAELKAYIKDLIKGQITSVARQEIKSIVEEAYKGKFDKIVEVAIRDEIRSHVREQLRQGYAIKDMAEKKVEEMITNFMKTWKLE